MLHSTSPRDFLLFSISSFSISFFFFFNDTATTEIYTLSLHDALPIFALPFAGKTEDIYDALMQHTGDVAADRKSTRLNSSHGYISYAVFCLKKKKKKPQKESTKNK